jgi:molybdopterin converting factor small subunit
MVVSVKFLGFQRQLTQIESVNIPLIENMRVADLLDVIMHQFPQLALKKEHILLTVNNAVCLEDKLLESNDHVSFIPHIGGG